MKPMAVRRPHGGWSILLTLAACIFAALEAPAIDFLEGRVQIHGYGETQLRTIARDYEVDANVDLTQWHLIGNVELELDIAPEGFGPFDLIGAYVRIEGRYDCLWTRACGLFNSVDTYGDRAERLPKQLSDARKVTFRGTLSPSAVRINSAGDTWDFGDTRPRLNIPLGQDGASFAVSAPPGNDPDTYSHPRPVPRSRYLANLWNVPALGQLFYALPGLDPDGVDGNLDPVVDPGQGDDDVAGCFTNHGPGALPCRYAGVYVTEAFHDYRFAAGSTRGPLGGQGSRVFGPWRPKDEISAWGALSDRVNPYNTDDVHPVLVESDGITPLTGDGDLPFRPAAEFDADTNGDGTIDGNDDQGPGVSRGLYYPSARVASAIADRDFDQPKINYDQDDLALNYGASQEQTHELKEAYLDVEMLDHSLWLRLGRQTIVWGKTELFRSQDQFNPQDLGLSSLPSLEESRVPLWSARGVYSLYNVGPLQDVRLEGAVLIDQFQPLDFGRCGEPYAPPQACDLAFGLFAHGLVGLGLAGQYLPEDPWDDFNDLEYGTRLEWRWDRLSFALTQFSGFPDVPYVKLVQEWERNVDPMTGRPRRAGATGPCDAGDEPSCFAGGTGSNDATFNLFDTDGIANPDTADVLANHHANQQLFATICASTVNTSTIRSSACAFNIWNSQERVAGSPVELTVAQAFSAILQGQGFPEAGLINSKVFYANLARWGTDGDLVVSSDFAGLTEEDRIPLVPLHVNSNLPDGAVPPAPGSLIPALQIDGWEVNGISYRAFIDSVCPTINDCAPTPLVRERGLSPALSVEQEALLGCGYYWGTDCDIHGFDLMNAEGSALTQSWPGFEGAGGSDWDPFDGSVAQPGTIGFDGGPACTRFDKSSGGTVVLPGCRGVLHTDIMRDLAGDPTAVWATFEDGYDLSEDGCVFAPTIGGVDVFGRYDDGTEIDLSNCRAGPDEAIRTLYHPFAGCLTPAQEAAGITCNFENRSDPYSGRDFDSGFLAEDGSVQVFRSEMAALSWNLMMVLVAASAPPDRLRNLDCLNPAILTETGGCADRPPRFDEFDVNDPERLDGCSFRRPFLCKSAGPFFATTGARRASVRAGGNTRYGRRDFQWHTGGVAVLDYNRRNVLGFSLDFPEDVTKTNWGMEFTWFDRVKMTDNDEFDGLTTTQHFNLSLSVDRPTFVRFLNAGRTFLVNGQLFLQYVDGYKRGFTSNGPLNVLSTLFIATAYHQDRLIPSVTFAHDYNSVSGAIIAGLTYRYTTQFSVSVGAAAFYGRVETAAPAIAGIAGPSGGAGRGAGRAYVENGLSSVRDRDELSLRFRYTF